MSLHVEFNEFNGSIITCWYIISTDPQFNIVGCCIGQVLCKPWRVVELTACTGGYTVLTIPEDIIGIECRISRAPASVNTTFAEVIISHKWRDKVICRYNIIARATLIRPPIIYELYMYELQQVQQQMSRCVDVYQHFHGSQPVIRVKQLIFRCLKELMNSSVLLQRK